MKNFSLEGTWVTRICEKEELEKFFHSLACFFLFLPFFFGNYEVLFIGNESCKIAQESLEQICNLLENPPMWPKIGEGKMNGCQLA